MNLDQLAEFGMNSPELSAQTVAMRLGAAALLSMLVGWERELHDRPAGLRTHMMVGLGAAAFYLITIEFILGEVRTLENLSVDPTRIFEGVITGIGFLGAGAIIQRGVNVVGLTTGAGIWTAGAIGLACGGGYIVIAAMVTAFALLVLGVMLVEARLFSGGRRNSAEIAREHGSRSDVS